MPTKNKSNVITIERIYDAPVKMVWDAWTDPEQVAKWWGPRGFTLTSHSKELKPGGHWSYTMHGPDGVDYPNKTKYFEVEKYAKLVYDHGASDDRPALFRVTALFAEIKGKTHLSMSMALSTPEAAEETRKFIKKAGGESTWDRLAEYLEKESHGKEKFVINRSFDASIEQLFEMWSNPKHLSQWLAPSGCRMEFLRSEIKPAGSVFYFMEGEGGYKLHGRASYLEIRKPNHLLYTQQFCDEKENISRHPMAPTWPETMLTTVTLTAEALDRTRVTVAWEPHGNVSREELETFIKERAGMTQGWAGSFDKLEDLLAQG